MIDWMTRESVRGCASRNLYVILADHADFNSNASKVAHRARLCDGRGSERTRAHEK